MAHHHQQEFCRSVRALFPHFFDHQVVVDFGSLDINGNNQVLFADCAYIGVDLIQGPNVDVISKAHEYQPDEPPDIVVSTEMLEHDEHWQMTLWHMMDILRPGGLMMFTCATEGRGEHGTARANPADSPATLNYYWNLTEADVRSVLDCDKLFENYAFSVELATRDLYFWGVKREAN